MCDIIVNTMIYVIYCREEALARVQEALGEEIYRADKERTEMERVREELYLEEQEEAARQKEKDEFGQLIFFVIK